MAVRRRGWRVLYLDPYVSPDDARRAAAADERVESFAADADVVLLATPVDVAVEQLRTLQTRSIVTSACSVMRALREVATVPFVAGHPLAGSHERGLGAARADLFEGKRWFVDGDHDAVDALIADCGAQRERVEAAEHDAALALTSHIPQILSTALAAYLNERGDDQALRFAGSGLRTFLRLAGSDASVWAPILDANRDNIAPHAEAIAQIVRRIIEGEGAEFFTSAQRLSKRL